METVFSTLRLASVKTTSDICSNVFPLSFFYVSPFIFTSSDAVWLSTLKLTVFFPRFTLGSVVWLQRNSVASRRFVTKLNIIQVTRGEGGEGGGVVSIRFVSGWSSTVRMLSDSIYLTDWAITSLFVLLWVDLLSGSSETKSKLVLLHMSMLPYLHNMYFLIVYWPPIFLHFPLC